MPELPEVQTLVDDLNAAGLVGKTFTAARVFWPNTIADLTPAVFQRRMKGKGIKSIWRRGKFLVFDLSPRDHLLILIASLAAGNRVKIGLAGAQAGAQVF